MSSHSTAAAGDTRGAEPHSLRASRLSAALTVRDLERSLAWYRDVMGFAIGRKYEHEGRLRGVVLEAGDVRILVGQDDGAKGFDRVKGEGFSLQLTTSQNVDELATRMKERGATLESEPADVWGARMFRLRDPDGFKLVISSER